MFRHFILLSALGLGLTGCGQSGSSEAAPVAPPRPEPTPAEKAVLLAALPAPYNTADLDNGRRAFETGYVPRAPATTAP